MKPVRLFIAHDGRPYIRRSMRHLRVRPCPRRPRHCLPPPIPPPAGRKPTSRSSCRAGARAGPHLRRTRRGQVVAAGAALPWRRLRRRRPGQRRAAWRSCWPAPARWWSRSTTRWRPTHPFPQPSRSATRRWMALQAAQPSWPARARRVFLAGEEAGGNLAAAVALMARDRAPPAAGRPDPAVADARPLRRHARRCARPRATPRSASGPTAGRSTCAARWTPTHPYAVPGASPRLAGLAPTLVLTGQDDPMRDEALAFADGCATPASR